MPHVGLLLGTLTAGHVGGSETYVRGLLGAFAAGEGPSRTTVLTHRNTANALGLADRGTVGIRELAGAPLPAGGPARAASLLGALARARLRPLPAGGVEVAHVPLTVPAPRLAGAPLVITLHDVIHHEQPASFGRAELAFRRLAYDGPARRAALVITVSEHARAAIVRRLRIPPDRVVAIAHGIDHERFTPLAAPDDAARLAGLGLPPHFVVYPANLWPHKNHERLLAGLAATAERDLALVFTGRRDDRWGKLEATARRLGLGRRVQHVGYLPAATLPALYRRAAGLAFPSLAEGFGAPTLEAMACGCPVAAAGTGAVGEVVGEAAITFDPFDVSAIGAALDRLVSDAAVRDHLRAAGLARAAGFTWAASARAHADAYRTARYPARSPAAQPRPPRAT